MKNLDNYGVLEIGKDVLNISGGCGQFRASDLEESSGGGFWEMILQHIVYYN